ncbi:START domain-containing protein 10-like [Temnothorax longispinosus]|uniref:START domain-containing protein 10-like n=1 Tax=Temnothorax longispinosus TaxID=300112 RepID=UPI003A98FFBE
MRVLYGEQPPASELKFKYLEVCTVETLDRLYRTVIRHLHRHLHRADKPNLEKPREYRLPDKKYAHPDKVTKSPKPNNCLYNVFCSRCSHYAPITLGTLACPSPLKNRDFVLQRSWLDTGIEQLILNHSVYHKDYPPRKHFVRATSYLTGYIVRPSRNGDGSELGYVSHTDPHGKLPVWLVNKVTQIFAPKMVKRLHKASVGYPSWKVLNNPNFKPWHYPEQIMAPRIRIEECVKSAEEKNSKYNYVDESDLKESLIRESVAMDSD